MQRPPTIRTGAAPRRGQARRSARRASRRGRKPQANCDEPRAARGEEPSARPEKSARRRERARTQTKRGRAQGARGSGAEQKARPTPSGRTRRTHRQKRGSPLSIASEATEADFSPLRIPSGVSPAQRKRRSEDTPASDERANAKPRRAEGPQQAAPMRERRRSRSRPDARPNRAAVADQRGSAGRCAGLGARGDAMAQTSERKRT